ncbi:MAG TPA: HAMP domain-containing histidine kinase [Crocinitomix sp.]|nr:HAMP domain-containing histidine kinase [Crocinitomix sp.]
MSLTNKPLTRLLERQLKKTIGIETIDNPKLKEFINLVNEAYIFNKEEAELYRLAEDISSKDYTELNNKLQQKISFLDTFNHGLAHDIKNHSTNIIGLVNMLKKYTQNENWRMIKKIINNIDDSSRQLTSIVEGFLFLSRNETDKKEEYEIINPKQIIKSVNNEIEYLKQRKEVDITYDIEEIEFIEPIIKIIFVNLISNSIKYSKENKTATISVRLTSDRQNVFLTVKDNGIGIDLKDTNNKLFNLFNNSNATKGYGVGLFLVKKITDLYQGTIKIDSELNKGTIIDIVFNKKIEL